MATFSTSRSRRRDVIPLASHGMVKSWSHLGWKLGVTALPEIWWSKWSLRLRTGNIPALRSLGVDSPNLFGWLLKGTATTTRVAWMTRQPHWIKSLAIFAVLPKIWSLECSVCKTDTGRRCWAMLGRKYDSCYLMPVLYHHFLRKPLFSSVPIWSFSILAARGLESWTQLCHQQLRTVVSVERSCNVRRFWTVRVPVGGFK